MNLDPNMRVPFGTLFSLTVSNVPFSNRPFHSLCLSDLNSAGLNVLLFRLSLTICVATVIRRNSGLVTMILSSVLLTIAPGFSVDPSQYFMHDDRNIRRPRGVSTVTVSLSISMKVSGPSHICFVVL